jgi:hypothetical protein
VAVLNAAKKKNKEGRVRVKCRKEEISSLYLTTAKLFTILAKTTEEELNQLIFVLSSTLL